VRAGTARGSIVNGVSRLNCRALLPAGLNEEFVQDLRAATNGGWALGDARLKQQIAKALGRHVEPLPKGYPPKASAAASIKSTLTPFLLVIRAGRASSYGPNFCLNIDTSASVLGP
jgi:hypothetical protein